MHYQDCLTEALEIVLASDLPDDLLANAIIDRSRLMAGVNPDEFWEPMQTTS